MALVNSKYKFIFFHLFRCGGNSARRVFDELEGNMEIEGGHANARDIKEVMYEVDRKEDFDNYFKFTIVRNPFDWLVSTYSYVLHRPNRFHDAIQGFNFTQFVQYYVDVMMKEKMRVGGNKCSTILQFVSDANGELLTDYIGKFEEMNASIKIIQERAGLPIKEIPIVNIGQHRHKRDYKTYYTAEAVKLVEKHFQQDLEHFKYKY